MTVGELIFGSGDSSNMIGLMLTCAINLGTNSTRGHETDIRVSINFSSILQPTAFCCDSHFHSKRVKTNVSHLSSKRQIQ